MVFSSLLFLFRFLPIVLAVYYAVPKRIRNLVLFIFSLIFYAWGEPVYIFIMLFSTVFDYSIGLWMDRARKKDKPKQLKAALVCSIVVNLSILSLFKYSNFAIDTVNSVFGADFAELELALPIGISFYTFQTMSYSIDVYRNKVDVQKNIISFGAYVSMFPQLIAGPIVRYKTVAKEIDSRKENLKDFGEGAVRFSAGLGKKVLIANTIGALFTELSAETGQITVATAWLGILAYTFQIYFDFSGYSDMAIGLGKMFGFHFPENFDYPYQSKSITEFWRKWHISLSSFFKEYVYIPLGGNRKGLPRQLFNILVVWLLTGLWHGASWNFVLWGLYYAVILVAEKVFLLKWLKKCPPFVRQIYTFVLVMFGWAIFTYSDMADGAFYLASMFGGGGISFADSKTKYYLANYAVMFIAAVIGSTDIPKRIGHIISLKTKNNGVILKCVFVAAMLILSTMSLISDSYNPFLYFRF